MAYKICVALQIKSGDLKENEELIREALNAAPDLIELRLDYIEKIEYFTEVFIKSLLNLIQPSISVIITLRDSSEGGQMEIDKDKRINLIKMLIRCQPQYLDVEMSTEKQDLEEIIKLADQNNVKLILSCHNFEKTPSFEDCTKIIENLSKRIKNIERFILKTIFTAQKFEDNFIPLKICREYSQKKQEIISFCMGEEGIFSRILCVKFGSAFTYASIAESTASGQININTIREVIKLLFDGK